MAGHSKFKNIQHRKGAQDKKRSKLFSKLGREITVAAKLGGGDADMNPRLRLAIATARGQSMPKDGIERAIQKGVGSDDGDDYFEIRYEGYGPAGVAIIVECLSDNKNRTASDVRSTFSKYGGNLGETGSVGFMFDRKGEIIFPLDKGDADTVFEAALEAGAEDVASDDETHDITTAPEDFAVVRDALETTFGEPQEQGLVWRANVNAEVTVDQAVSVLKLIDVLEDNDDVQNVTSNLELTEEIMQKFMEA
jgi:YebC/PmpR family DNA-binding regulatory protein|tara:strand:+ start:442704 stop:443456 length:753 start_codon:yes stop_codon:yes gene_type:complete